MTKDYDFETATEGERWAYDQGIEAAHDPAKMDMDDVRDALEACLAALNRIIAERRTGVDSTTHTCPGCGATVIGHDTCGDPTRPGCRS